MIRRSPLPPRRKQLARSSGPSRKAPVRNKRRKPSEFARIYGSQDRVEWVKSLPCVACGVLGHSENAHIKTGGVSRKADARFIVPLCASRPSAFAVLPVEEGCHSLLHRVGRQTFESHYNVHLVTAAAQTELAWGNR